MNHRPNILFCLADDAGMHFGACGCPWVSTPAFDRVAANGILFSQAYTCNSKCAPSRAAVLTGRNSWQLKDAANHQCHFPAGFTTVFEALGDHGYHTGYTGKGWAPGDPGTVEGSPRKLTGTQYDIHTQTPPTPCMSGDDYAANFDAFVDRCPPDTPFCFWYGCREPHRRYTYGSGVAQNGHDPSDVDEVYEIWPDNEVVRTDLLDYGYEIEHFDRHISRMLNSLQARGQLKNTLIVVTYDNGLPFPRCKGQEYYYSNHLPLAIMWGEGIRNPGRVVSDMVSFIDFAPTFLDVAGIAYDDSGMAPITGQSLQDIFAADGGEKVTHDRDRVLIGKERHDLGRPGDVGYPIRGIFTDRFLYVRNLEPQRWPAGNPETGYMNCDGSPTKSEILRLRREKKITRYWEWSFGKRPEEELYDIVRDPNCIENLAADPGYDCIRKKLRERMEGELIAQKDPRMIGGPPLDENPVNDPDGNRQNYYHRLMRGEIEGANWINPDDVEHRSSIDQQ